MHWWCGRALVVLRRREGAKGSGEGTRGRGMWLSRSSQRPDMFRHHACLSQATYTSSTAQVSDALEEFGGPANTFNPVTPCQDGDEGQEDDVHQVPADERGREAPGAGDALRSQSAPVGGGAGAQKGACFNLMRGACSHGATCRFSHDASVIDAARVSYQPQGAREILAQKWSQRPSPGRSGDPPARVNGNTPIAGAWILAEDRWSICEQTEGKCFLRHVKCQGDCVCALCQAPNGKKWPKMVAARVPPAGWKGEE